MSTVIHTMKLVRQILFSLVLLIILGHSSLAHSHERCVSFQQIEASEKSGLLYLLEVVIASNTGSYHLEDYRHKKAVVNSSATVKSAPATTASIPEEPPIRERSCIYPVYTFSFRPTLHFYSVYSLRGSPC
ncbi:hypothetical protein [Carboxylicivirga taeanensis]|uniref:hypothetical protein n=1 Tax=Carboxylicivirga taeanensis TaxID=1416875 RepID=UPI003F6E2F28